MMNRKFGRVENDALIYAPDTVTVAGRKVYNPQTVHYRLAGYLPVVDRAPTEPAPEGYHWERKGWAVSPDGQSVTAQYEAVQNPPAPPKVYSTADAIYALMSRGVWETCREWIAEHGFLDLVLATKEFTDDLENFGTIKDGLQTLLDYTDEQVAEVLKEAEVE